MQGGIRVLHVDDEPDLADLTAEFLVREDERFDVHTVSSVPAALDRLDAESFDCIVSDYDMPGQDGIEFLETVRETEMDLPFILYTGKGSEEVASDAISAGVTEYLQKESGTGQYAVLANRIQNAVEQYRSRQQLEENQQRLSLFFEQSPLGMIEWTPDYRVKRVNARAEELLGYSEAELVGEPWDVIVPADERDAIEEVLDSVSSHEGGYYNVNENVRKDGTRIVSEWHNRTIADDDGEIVASFSMFQDITERVERERKLTELRDRAQRLMYTESREETAAEATDAANDIIGAPLSGVHLLTDDGDALEIVAQTTTVSETFDDPLYYRRDAESGTRAAVIWEVFLEGEPLHIEDTAAYEPLTEDSPAGSVILHPLGDHGLFVISSSAPNEFDETDEVLVDVLGSFLTTAMDRVVREERLRDRERRLERLHHATREIMALETHEEITERVMEAAEAVLDFRIAVVRQYDPELHALVPVAETEAVAEVMPPRVPFPADADNLNWIVYETGETRMFEDVQTIEGAADAGTALRSLVILSLGSYGTLSVGETTPSAFDEGDIFLAQILATATETALERTDRETDIRSQRDVLERRANALRSMHDIIADRDRPFTEQVEALLELGRTELGTKYGTLSRIEGTDYHFEFVAADDDSIEAGDVAPVSATNCEIAASTEQTLVLGDVERDAPEETDRAGFTEWGIACYIGAPIYQGDDVYGTFCFYDTTPLDGQFSDWEVTLVDLMSRWVSTQLDRRQAAEQLQREHDRLDRFTSVVSHDIRNPLNVVAGRLDLAEETGDPEEFERCRTAIERIETLIDELLELARAGAVIAEQSPVALDDVAKRCWTTIDTRDATLSVETTRTVEADEPRLRQVLENLFQNSVEHGSTDHRDASRLDDAVVHGGDDVTVTIGDLPDGFYVEDDGPGIPPEAREHVFQYGYSTDSSGTGFGLSIVDEIARAHDWDVTVTDSDSGGARFEFTNVTTRD